MRKGLWKCKKKHLTKFKSIYGNKLGNTLRNTFNKKLALNLLDGEKRCFPGKIKKGMMSPHSRTS